MAVMIIAFNPVNWNSIFIKTPGIIPRCHLKAAIRPQTKAESFQLESGEGLRSPPPPNGFPSNIMQRGTNKAENGFVRRTMAHR